MSGFVYLSFWITQHCVYLHYLLFGISFFLLMTGISHFILSFRKVSTRCSFGRISDDVNYHYWNPSIISFVPPENRAKDPDTKWFFIFAEGSDLYLASVIRLSEALDRVRFPRLGLAPLDHGWKDWFKMCRPWGFESVWRELERESVWATLSQDCCRGRGLMLFSFSLTNPDQNTLTEHCVVGLSCALDFISDSISEGFTSSRKLWHSKQFGTPWRWAVGRFCETISQFRQSRWGPIRCSERKKTMQQSI
jgi:hypothetical protein